MSDNETERIAVEAAVDFKRQVEHTGMVRLQAGELMASFGLAGMDQTARESVADALWEADVQVEPSLTGTQVDTSTKVKLVRVDAAQVDAALAWQQTPAGERAAFREARYAISPVAAGTAAVGGLLLAFASFLPLDQPSGVFARVQSNSLIQHGEWWLLLVGAALAIVALRAYTSGKRNETTGMLVLGLIGLALVIFTALDTSLRTLYPVGLNGKPDTSAPGTVVPLGIAIYVAGAGVLLALIGSWTMRATATVVPAVVQEATVRCPECAETILAAAHVCKHCGYRLEHATNDTAS